ncbi:MAG: hypothetical protein J5733_06945, partial [Bacteroidaceae bacterium]|nr:hypothetical protein [Bacteroidaceae bacterium]
MQNYMLRHTFLLLSLLVCLNGFGERTRVVGTLGDKAVKAYRKMIPQQAEGYYIKVTPQEIVVAGRDESGTFYGLQALKTLSNSPLQGEDLFHYLKSQYKEVD